MKIHRLLGTLPLLVAGLLTRQVPAQQGLVLIQDNISFAFPLTGHQRWTGNRLAGCDYCTGGQQPILWVVDRQGNREAVAFEVPGADYTQVRDVAAGPDGSVTAVGFAVSGDSRQGAFIAWISPDTTRQVVTRVWPYSPEVVTVAPDATIWTVGSVFNDNGYVQDQNVLRHYTTAGQLLTSNIVQGVQKNKGGTYKVGPASALMASNDRIGWLTAACQYIEFSLEAVQLGSYACPNGYTRIGDVSGVALSSADDLLVGGTWLAPLAPLELDRATNTWKPAPVFQDSGKTNSLLGFDGLTLVTLAMPSPGQGPAMRRYAWSNGPVVGGQ
jgi:hypothetical protein